MDKSLTLERWSRRLLAVAGVAFVFTGLSFFLLPEYAAENFPWNVSPLVAMTIGGWALGLGLMALETVRSWFMARVIGSLLAVWSFAILETVVVIGFLGVLRTDQWLTWPYLAGLLFGVGSAVLGLPVAWLRRRELRAEPDDGDEMPRPIRLVFAGFATVVFALAATTLLVTPVGSAVFPEPISAFTTRAFAAFFASLGFGALPLLVARAVDPAVDYSRAGLYLVVLITAAAFSFLHVFDFAARPGQLIYVGAYALTAVVALAIVMWHRGRTDAPRWRHSAE
ncbi:hypothetical protein BH24CHL5_BH24CHL5_06770 [soil metagenome]